jgi:hypothetical protein
MFLGRMVSMVHSVYLMMLAFAKEVFLEFVEVWPM